MDPIDTRELAGLTALVTGATAGLGLVVATKLAARGASVIIHGRDADRGAHVVADITANGGTARFIAADVGNPTEISRLVAFAGDIDILVNNAGHSVWGPTADFAVADFDALYASNVRAPFMLVAAFAPQMASRGTGSIVNIGSMAGTVGLVNGAAYGATKAALAALTRAWAAEYSASGVRVNIVAPGPIYTRPAAKDLFDALGETTAMKRAAQPDEIAAAVVFLASPSASYITGATIAIDGGRTAI